MTSINDRLKNKWSSNGVCIVSCCPGHRSSSCRNIKTDIGQYECRPTFILMSGRCEDEEDEVQVQSPCAHARGEDTPESTDKMGLI